MHSTYPIVILGAWKTYLGILPRVPPTRKELWIGEKRVYLHRPDDWIFNLVLHHIANSDSSEIVKMALCRV